MKPFFLAKILLFLELLGFFRPSLYQLSKRRARGAKIEIRRHRVKYINTYIYMHTHTHSIHVYLIDDIEAVISASNYVD